MGTCAVCGEEVGAGFRFCGQCGAPLESLSCPECGSANPPDHRFCGRCGGPLAGARTAAPPTSERKLATVLFADVVGFTSLAEHTDPETLARSVDGAFRRMGEVVVAHGGTVDKYMGDCLMALFGVPQAHDDDAERAVAAALAMAELGGDLAFSIGINTGEVMVTQLGGDGAVTVLGDAVNVAARLEKVAAPGEVLVGRLTAELAGDRLELARRQPVVVKGRVEPVEVWKAVAVRGAAITHCYDTPLVGRGDELSFLMGAWQRVVRDRRPGIVLVTGLPGIGKTRLIDELAATVLGSGAQTVQVSYPAYGGLGGSKVGAEMARQLGPSGDPQIDARIQSVAGELEPSLRSLDPAAMFNEQVWAYRRLVELRAEERPLLAVIDDAHRTTDRPLQLLGRLVAGLDDVPVMAVLAGRPEPPTWLGAFPSATVLRLDPLGAIDAGELARSFSPGRDLSDEVTLTVAQRAGGNPLFIRELVALAGSDGGDLAALPASLHAILAARLDALPPECKVALQQVAVLGGGCPLPQVAALGPPGVEAAIDQLLATGLLRAEGPNGELLSLADSLLAAVAYDMLPRDVRGVRHRRAAALATTAAERARHLERAVRFLAHDSDLVSEAAAALGQAGMEALDGHRTVEGVDVLHRAVALGLDEPAVLLRLAQTLADASRPEQAFAVLDRLPAGLEPAAVAAAVHIRALAMSVNNEVLASLPLFAQAIQAWTALERPERLGWAYTNRGAALMVLGRSDEAGSDFDRALTLFRKAGSVKGEMAVLNMLQLLRPDDPGVPEWLTSGLRYAELSGDRTGQLNSLTGLMWWTFLRSRLGTPEDTAEADATAVRMAELAAELGISLDELQGWSVAAILARYNGRLDVAVDRVRRSQIDTAVVGEGEGALRDAAGFLVEVTRRPETPPPPAYTSLDPRAMGAAIFVMEGLLLAGRLHDAACWGESFQTRPDMGPLGEMMVGLMKGWEAVVGGNHRTGADWLARVQPLADRLGWRPGQVMAAALLAEARVRLGDTEGGRAALASVANPDGTWPCGGIAGAVVLRARVVVGESNCRSELERVCAELAAPGLLLP